MKRMIFSGIMFFLSIAAMMGHQFWFYYCNKAVNWSALYFECFLIVGFAVWFIICLNKWAASIESFDNKYY